MAKKALFGTYYKAFGIECWLMPKFMKSRNASIIMKRR